MTPSDTTLIARRDRALGVGAPLFYREPLHLVRGDGVWLYAADGRRYVDMYNNVPCVGHANPDVVAAMTRQQGTLNVHSRYLHEGIVEFAERLCRLHSKAQIESVVFTCSGTEANEVAIRMARLATGRRGIVCTDATYHGSSEALGMLTNAGARPKDSEVRAFPFPQMYRPLSDGSGADPAAAYLEQLQAAIHDLESNRAGFAGLLLCPILANEGLPDIPAGFMARATELVHAHGGLVIADEVQAGYGRTGRWWGYEATGLRPDVVVTGKPMGNGLPLAAAAASRKLVDGFRAATGYFNTYASSPLQAAVGMAVLDVIERENLLANAAAVGAVLKQGLRACMQRCAEIGDVRGLGLFLGVEIVSERQSRTPDRDRAVDIVNRLKDRGFLTSNAGAFGNVIKIRPPLVFRQEHAEAFLDAFHAIVHELDE